MKNSEFQRKFICSLIHDCYEYQDNNTDFLTFGISKLDKIKRRFKDKLLIFARLNGFVRKNFSIEQASERLMYTLTNIDKLESFYQLLADDYSRQLLIELLKYRILGPSHVKLPLNNKKYWNQYFAIDKKFLKEGNTIKTGKWSLNRYKLQGCNSYLTLHAHPMGILNTFILEQYAYQKGNKTIKVQTGDIVIDAGSCWGDVALYFADKTGTQGTVYCFEFVKDNLDILQQNINFNKHLADRVKVVPKAVWDKSGEIINYGAHGPGTSLVRVKKEQCPLQALTVSIDDFVKEESIAKVDYIKMDIEGSELKALQGAEKTICTFRPKLSISLYHRDDDFIVIPDYLYKLHLGYEFFLDHFTIHSWETVLFANPAAK